MTCEGIRFGLHAYDYQTLHIFTGNLGESRHLPKENKKTRKQDKKKEQAIEPSKLGRYIYIVNGLMLNVSCVKFIELCK